MSFKDQLSADMLIFQTDLPQSVTITLVTGQRTHDTRTGAAGETSTPYTLDCVDIEHRVALEHFNEADVETGDVFLQVRRSPVAGLPADPDKNDHFVWQSLKYMVHGWIVESDENAYIIQGRRVG